ncbi:MAG: metal ABC transporter permease [Sinobacterium sp.]|nr:metal ABC transporter permease [Sinobacterium sp.]
MIIELIYPSLIIAAFIAVSAGLLSCFVLWKRMAFFADALSHSAILGTSIALFASIDVIWGLMGYGALVALSLSYFSNKIQLSSDTFLAIISQTSLAIGLITLSFLPQQFSIESLLFGDILSVGAVDIPATAVVASLIIIAVWKFHDGLIRLCLDEELAQTEGLNVNFYKTLLMLMLVALIATAIQLLGVLLVSTLLLIPAATARSFAKSPIQMLLLSPVIALLASGTGIAFSIQFDNIMTSPAIVVAATALWALSLTYKNSQ